MKENKMKESIYNQHEEMKKCPAHKSYDIK
jgi:hypothetical protein